MYYIIPLTKSQTWWEVLEVDPVCRVQHPQQIWDSKIFQPPAFMIHPRRIDRLLFASPLQLKFISKVTIRFSNDNKLAKSFIRDYVPLMAYGNPHIEFTNECVEDKQECCNILLEDGSSRAFNLKFYLYPQQLLQRILDLNKTD